MGRQGDLGKILFETVGGNNETNYRIAHKNNRVGCANSHHTCIPDGIGRIHIVAWTLAVDTIQLKVYNRKERRVYEFTQRKTEGRADTKTVG